MDETQRMKWILKSAGSEVFISFNKAQYQFCIWATINKYDLHGKSFFVPEKVTKQASTAGYSCLRIWKLENYSAW